MKRRNRAAGALLAFALVGGALPAVGLAQDGTSESRPRRSVRTFDRAYEVGFDAGYRIGYGKGADDAQSGGRRDVTNIKEYVRADDSYNEGVGNREQFRLGYQAGFEKAYADAFEGRQYGARPGDTRVAVPAGGGPVLGRGDANGADGSGAERRVNGDVSLVVELESPITTRYSRVGDRFSARVLEPQPYAGATVEGYVSAIEKPGRLKGKGSVVLAFDRIRFGDGYDEPLQAQVEEVLGYPQGTPAAGKNGPLDKAPWDWGKKKDRNDDIDASAGDEGTIKGESSKDRDVATVGGGAAVGAVLGGILGGGGGAVLGGVIGGAAGGGVVAGTKGRDIDLEPGVQLRIRTSQPLRSN